MTRITSQIRIWAQNNDITDEPLMGLLWAYELSLAGTTRRNNKWVEFGGPVTFDELKEDEDELTRTTEWRQAQRVLIAARWSYNGATGRKKVQQLYDHDKASTMTRQTLLRNRRAKLSEFGNDIPSTPPSPPGAYLHQGDPMAARLPSWELQGIRSLPNDESYLGELQ